MLICMLNLQCGWRNLPQTCPMGRSSLACAVSRPPSFFVVQSHSVTQAALELTVLLRQPPECKDFKYTLPYLSSSTVLRTQALMAGSSVNDIPQGSPAPLLGSSSAWDGWLAGFSSRFPPRYQLHPYHSSPPRVLLSVT